MKTKRPLSRRILFGVISLLFVLLIITVIGEIGLRIYYSVYDISIGKEEAKPPYNTAQKDDVLGWFPKGDYLFDGTMKDAGGKEYDIHLTTNKDGFRQYGNPNTDKKKVFFLGDSYTQSVEVSDDKVFYKIIGDSLPIEVFAYGMAGYGQLQQLMILDKYYDQIQPDVVVLQVCSNDFIDNHYALELESEYQVGLRRPYFLLDGKTVYEHPISVHQQVKEVSLFFGFLLKRWNKVRQKMGFKKTAEQQIFEQERNYEAYDYSVKVTEMLFKKIIDRLGDKTKLLVFNADHYEPQLSEFKRICVEYEVPYAVNPVYGLREKEDNGVTVRSFDRYHWNEAGHQIIGTVLMKDLK